MKKLTPKEIVVRIYRLLFIGMVTAFVGIVLGMQMPVITLGLLLMAASAILQIVFYRCPHCGKMLNRRTGEYCPKCGKKVNETE